MESERLQTDIFWQVTFAGEMFGHVNSGKCASVRFEEIFVMTAEKSVLVRIAKKRFPFDVELFRQIKDALAAEPHAVADPDDVARFVTVGKIIMRQWPRRANIVVLQPFILPKLRVDDIAVGVDEHGKIRIHMTAELVDCRFVPVVYRGKFLLYQLDCAELDAAARIVESFSMSLDVPGSQGDEGDVGELEFGHFRK